MSGPSPYFAFPGTAREALSFYQSVFGGDVRLNTYAEFGRTDGPGDAVAHGMLVGDVPLFAADAAEGEASFRAEGLLLSLLGADEPAVLRAWFDGLSAGGTIVDPLQERPWGDWDGQVKDRYGVTWLIGFEGSAL
ncbi:VOC family protein [Leifsonia sp. AG29]|uniref:VOC family protein n=1 Tax=Leifsonia sp. AG29 TaxID=2598860 RepID=UPI00131E1A50|nr:VOC family protein [Leifsonia sp. AG29]